MNPLGGQNFNFRRFVLNLSYLFGANIYSSIILLFQGILLVRYLGSENYGVWSLSRSLPAMYFILMDLGLNSVVIREVARRRRREQIEYYFTNLFLAKLGLAAVFLAVLGGSLVLFDYPARISTLVMISALAYIALTFSDVVIVLFKALENFKWQAGYSLAQTSGIFALIALNAFLGNGLSWILLSIAGYQALLVCVFYGLAFRQFRFRWDARMALGEYFRLIRRALPFALISIMGKIFSEVDTVMLSKMASFHDVGIYNASYRLIGALMMFPLFFGQVLFPSLSFLYRKDLREFMGVVLQFEKFIIILLIPLCVLFFRFAEPIVLFLFGAEYRESIPALKILSFALAFYFLYVSYSVALNASGREKWVAGIITLSCVVKVGFNFLLIPQLASVGTSFAAAMGEFSRLSLGMVCFAVAFRYAIKWKTVFRVGVVLLPLGILFVQLPPLYAIVLYPLGLASYLVLLFKSELLSFHELKLLWQSFSGQSSGAMVAPRGGA
ncbi:MAG: flippase [Calditrichaeota bacterium]|nr:MAG: flippase [Calditrichota bacterium]